MIIQTTTPSMVQMVGAGCFGAIIGWYVYYINRYRKGDVQLGDLVTVIGVIGGAGILALFKPESDLFGAYGIGLAIGFFGYFLSLIILVARSQDFNRDWFLDGRRVDPATGKVSIPGDAATTYRPMRGGENVVPD